MTSRLLRLPALALSLCAACASHAQSVAGPASSAPASASSPAAPSAAPPTTRPVESAFDPARHMHTAEVVPGMKGYGLSVFHGTKIERFNVEVISVMRNQVGPEHNIVLIRCSGQGLEHSGAIEGMSGSPIYLTDSAGKDRMIGAFALGWENSKDPIAGVRPIEEMLSVPTAYSIPVSNIVKTGGVRRWNALPLIRLAKPVANPAAANLASGGQSSQLKRLSLPLSVSGVSDAAFAQLSPMLKMGGLTPLQAGALVGTEADPKAKLEPGASIGLPIVTGDLDVSALGTVTEIVGDRVYAFGHEFNAEGAVDLPMGVGYVHTVIPSSTISFKIGSLMRLDGAIHSDESTAIAGTLGSIPAMIPVTVTVHTPQRAEPRTFHFEITKHPKFTPMGAVTSVTGAVMADSSLPADFTIKYTMTLAFDNGRTVELADTATSATRAKQLARDLNLPLTLALQNPFGRTYPTSITAKFEVEPKVSLDELTAAVTDKLVYQPGETASIYVTTLPHGGGEVTRHVPITLPDDLAEGDYTLTVGDADRALSDETRDSPYRYETRDLDEVFGLIKEVTQRSSQKLYIRLASHGQGVSVGRTPLIGLPASRVRVMARPGRADVMPFVPAITESVPWSAPLQGSTDIEIKVSRTPEKVARPLSAPTATPPMPAAEEGPPSAPAAAGDGG
ncbi:MAG: SpoIVB peptidase [Phycisphaerales bacterium]|nr:SpoIVB peptidase [Phycisphaerales bacterium]